MMTGNAMLSDVVLYDKYARWMPEKQRRETWPEVVTRVLQFFQTIPQAKAITGAEWNALHEAMLAKEVLPSMRVVQMAGPALSRCHVGAYNCAYTTLDSPTALAELLYILMQGTGVGYSVEARYINQWPIPRAQSAEAGFFHPETVVVPDTTEGWCDAFKTVMANALQGQRTLVDYTQIRPAGAWLNTKGGTASGPEPLKKLLEKAESVILSRMGAPLRPIDIHRLACICGSIVQVGGVRRAALICLFDPDDAEMRTCKNGNFWEHAPELAMANNSMVMTGDVPDAELLAMFAQLAKEGSGEPGLFRRDGVIPARRQRRDDFGTNPCGEIILRPQQFCNLSIAVARPTDTPKTMAHKVMLATLLGTLQSCLTRFNYLRPIWQQNSEEERLLGVDITGMMDHPEWGAALAQGDSQGTPNPLFLQWRRVARAMNEKVAERLDIQPSAAVTCNKPSGNSSQLLDCASGIHVRYAPYYVRRIRLGARSPLALHLQAKGLTPEPEVGQGTLDEASVWVFALPVQSPAGAVTRHDVDAVDQLNIWLRWKMWWTEHNPSATIYVDDKPGQWVQVAQWVAENWANVGGLSFLKKDTHTYQLAPYEEIDEATYQRLAAQLPASLDLHEIVERVDLTTVNQEYACVGGICEI